MVKIFIDAGHGGKDPGAVGLGLREKDLTLAISLKIRDILQKEYTNVDVRLSRTTDVYLTLAERARLANAWGADFFLSIHINATPSGYGYEDYIYTHTVNLVSFKAQNAINLEVVKATKWRNRGKKRKNLQVLRDTRMAALLTESGFIDNPTDAKLLKDDTFLNEIARGHVNGLAIAFKLKKKSNVVKPTPPKKEVDEMAQLLPDTQKNDMRTLLKRAYDNKVFSTNHTSKVDKMTRGQATDLLISYVARTK